MKRPSQGKEFEKKSENLKVISVTTKIHGTEGTREPTAKRPDTTAIGTPCVEGTRIPSNSFSEPRYKLPSVVWTTRVCWWLYQTGLVIKNWPWYIQNTDNPITGNWESNYCLYFDKMHRKRRVWPFPCHHQQRLASVPGAPCFPEGPFIICLSWGEGVQSISVSYCPFLFRQMLALLQFTRIGTGLRKSY